MSKIRFIKSTLQGKYCGAIIRLISHEKGYPYRVAPISLLGLFGMTPVNGVIMAPPIKE